MTSNLLAKHSLKIKITLATLGIFLAGIWILEVFVSRTLHEDMQQLSSEQQLSAVSFIAADLNNEFGERFRSLEAVAAELAPVMVGNKATLVALLTERPVLHIFFNGGIIVYGNDGKEIVRATLSAGRIKEDSRKDDYAADPLNEGKRKIGKPYFSRSKRFPEFVMAVPIRDTRGEVIGALGGVIDLAQPSFLDDVSRKGYGKTGDYLLVAPQHRLIVTASDKSRVMEQLPARGANPVTDRFDQGDEYSAVTVNPHGVEVLASAKGIPVAGWIVAAILPTEEAFGPIRTMNRRMLLATIFLSLMVAAATAWVLRYHLKPMFATARTLGIMSESGQPLQPLPVLRQDELGQLVGGFNRLLVSLEARNGALRESETLLKESQRQLRDLASSLQTVREEERTALARELHDELGQQLLRLRMDLSWLKGRIRNQAPELLEKVESMKRFIDGSVDSLRHLTTELRLPLLDDLGLAAAALWLLDDFSKRTGIEVESTVALNGTEMDEHATINLFRMLQESLTNVTRHAGATRVYASLCRTEEGLVLDVRDNGCGTELRDKPTLGHGLVGIRERALQLGGRMEIASAPGEGFAIHVCVPLKAAEIKGEQT